MPSPTAQQPPGNSRLQNPPPQYYPPQRLSELRHPVRVMPRSEQIPMTPDEVHDERSLKKAGRIVREKRRRGRRSECFILHQNADEDREANILQKAAQMQLLRRHMQQQAILRQQNSRAEQPPSNPNPEMRELTEEVRNAVRGGRGGGGGGGGGRERELSLRPDRRK